MAPLNPYGFAVVAGQLIEGVVCELVLLIGILLIADFILSGLGGMLAKALSDAIAKTGVLNSFAIGQAQGEEI
jgi:ABC-type thiamin/hydroxymethylpyrimidine transport system permease subunit